MANNVVQVVVSAESSAAVQGFQSAQQAAQSFSSEMTATASASASASVALQTTAASADTAAASFAALDLAAAAVIAVIAAVVAVVGSVAAVMVTSADSAIALGDATRRLTRETGIASVQGSELLGVFDRYGVSADAASRSLGIFEKNLRTYVDAGDKAHEKTTGFAGAINELGIQTTNTDGSIRPMSALLDDVANKFANLQDGPEKTALAMQLFGRSGKDMIAALDLGGPAIDALSQKLGDLGLSMSSEQVANVRAYELAHKDLSQAIQGVSVQLGNALMPAMTAVMQGAAGLAEAFNANVMPSIRDFGAWIVSTAIPAISALAGGFSAIVPVVEGAAQAIFGAGQTLVSMAEAAYTWGANIVVQFANGMASAMQPIFDVINSIGDAIASLMMPGSPPRFLPNIDVWGHDTAQVYLDAWTTADVQSPIDAMGGNLKSALTKVNNEIQDIQDRQRVEALQKQIATGKLHGDQLALAQLEIQKTLIAEQERDAPQAAAKSGKSGGSGSTANAAAALAKAQQDVALYAADAAGKVAIWQDAVNKAKPDTIEYAHAQLELAKAQDALKKSQEQSQKTLEQQAAAINKAKLDDALASADLAGKVQILDDAQKAAAPGSVEQIDLHRRETEAKNALARAAEQEAAKKTAASEAIEKAQLAANLAAADGAGKVALLTQARDKEQVGSVAYLDLQRQLTEQQLRNEAASDRAGKATAALTGHHVAAGGAAATHAGHVASLAGAHGAAAVKAADHAAAMDRLKDGLDGLQKPTTTIKDLTNDAAKAHTAYVTAAGHVRDAIQGVKDKFQMVSDFVHGTVIPAFTAVKDAMMPMVVSVTAAVQNINDIFQNYGIKAGLTAMLNYAKVWGGEFVGWIGEQLPPIEAQLALWGEQFWAWIEPALLALLINADDLKNRFVGWIGDQAAVILAKLTTWADSFVASVPTLTMRFLDQWPDMLDRFLNWIGASAGPILVKLADWALSFVAWIAPNIPNILAALAGVALAITAFIVETAVVLAVKIVEWSNAFLSWVGRDVLPKLGGVLATILNAMGTWVNNTAIWLHGQMMNMGAQMVTGIQAGIEGAWGALSSWASKKMGDLVNTLKNAIKIGSPSRVMADEIGAHIPSGIAAGITENMHHTENAMQQVAAGMVSSLSSVGDMTSTVLTPVLQHAASTVDLVSAAVDTATLKFTAWGSYMATGFAVTISDPKTGLLSLLDSIKAKVDGIIFDATAAKGALEALGNTSMPKVPNYSGGGGSGGGGFQQPGSAPGPSDPGQGDRSKAGAVVNNYNMTVNTAATAPTVMQDFHLMKAMAG